MSIFLEILRCVLCCVKEDRDENDSEPLYRNTSWETRLNLSDEHVNYRPIFHSGTSNSLNIGSTYAKSVERFHDVIDSLKQSTKYVPVPSFDTPTSSSRLPQSSSIQSLSGPKPQPSCNQIHSSLIPKTTCTKPSLVSPKCQPPSSKPSPQAPSPSLNPSPSIPKPPTCHSKLSPSFPSALASSSKPTAISPAAPQSLLGPSPSASKAPPSFKPTLAPASLNSIDQQNKANYISVQKNMSPIYAIPQHIQDLIKRDRVPKVLKKPLSLLTYKKYFAALLYAEDFYIEKWSEFKLVNATLKLQEAKILQWSYLSDRYDEEDKFFVSFEIDASREKRPFLLSRDFVFVRPSGTNIEPFKGIIYRVERSTNVLVEFGGDFLAQHYSSRKYDVSFSFNRVCLKRAHQAIKAASDPLFESFTFPDYEFRRKIPTSSPAYRNYKLDMDQISAVSQIIIFQGSPPYLIEGPFCVTNEGKKGHHSKKLSRTGLVVQQAVLEIYRRSKTNRVLICAPINSTCDFLTRSLMEIPESEIFRANAAFREIDEELSDILALSLYKDKCFACPPFQELKKFRVILSTYISSFRLHNEGVSAGHFSHIFMVDASSATEPEAMVALANLANEDTAVIVTGAPKNRSGWVRSDLARKNGLMISYFERLRKRNPYRSLDPKFITQLVDSESKSDDSDSLLSFSYI